MIPILPLIILIVRHRNLRRLSREDLPNINAEEFQEMRKENQMTMTLASVIVVLSFVVPLALAESQQDALIYSLGITIVGLSGAAYNDLKAHRIARRGRASRCHEQTLAMHERVAR